MGTAAVPKYNPLQPKQYHPLCIKNYACSAVCNSINCKNVPFVCKNQKCECKLLHKSCTKDVVKLEVLKEHFSQKKRQPSNELKKYLGKVEQIYKKILKQIQILYTQVKSISSSYGLNELEKNIFLKMKQGRFTQLTGSQINKLKIGSERQMKKIQIYELQSDKKEIQHLKQKMTKILKHLTEKIQISFNLDSNITKEKQVIEEFFIKNIKQTKLLYRASQNNFQVQKFWDSCHKKQNTLIIIKTQFGKIIGGYTPLAWDSDLNGKYSKDEKRQSFLFSITEKHKLPLIIGRQMFAIKHYNNYGPNFGGNNIHICDRANKLANSTATVGDNYNNFQYVYGNQQSLKKFNGQSNGKNFLIEEWEVHEIIFE